MSEMFEVAQEERLTKDALRGRQRHEGKKRRVMCLLARGSGHPLRIRGEKQEEHTGVMGQAEYKTRVCVCETQQTGMLMSRFICEAQPASCERSAYDGRTESASDGWNRERCMRRRCERVKCCPPARSTKGDRGVSRQCGCRMVLVIGTSRKQRGSQ